MGHATRLIGPELKKVAKTIPRHDSFLASESGILDDVTGNVTAGGEWSGLTADHLTAALTEFVGRISQVPPQRSSKLLHVQGRRAFDCGSTRPKRSNWPGRLVDVFATCARSRFPAAGI